MKLQELTTEELMNIDGGGFIYEVFYIAARTLCLAADLSNSLKGDPNFGNPLVYK